MEQTKDPSPIPRGSFLSREAVIMSVFLIHAVASGGIFTRIPDIQAALALNEATLGLVLMAQPVGGLLSFLIASFIVERVGPKRICLITIPMMALGSFVFAAAPFLAVGVVGLLLYGASFSVVNVAMNVEADRVEAITSRKIMNRCHGWWSIGFLAASLIGVGARAFAISAPVHLGLMALLSVLAVCLIVWNMRESPARAHSDTSRRRVITFPSGATLRIVGFGLVGSFVQGATHNWSVIYMRDSFAAPDWVDALSIPAFLLALSLGRMFGDGWVTRYGTYRVAVALISVALVGLLMVIFSGALWQALIGFGLMGLGISTTFPLMITAAAQLGDRASSANVAAVTMTTGIAMLAVPPIMGLVAEAYSIRTSFMLLVPVFILGFSLVRFVVPKSEISAR